MESTLQTACSENCECKECSLNRDGWTKGLNITKDEYNRYFQLSEFDIPVYGATEYLNKKIRKMAGLIYRKRLSKNLKTKKPAFIKLVIQDLMRNFDSVKKELLQKHMTNWYVLDKMERDGVIKCDYNQLKNDFLNRKYK